MYSAKEAEKPEQGSQQNGHEGGAQEWVQCLGEGAEESIHSRHRMCGVINNLRLLREDKGRKQEV